MRTTRVAFGSTDSAYDAGRSISSTRHAWFALCWCLALAGTALAQVDVVTVTKEEPICSDTDDPFIDVPVNMCNILVHLEEPSVLLLAVGNAEITTDDPAGFFQHALDSTPLAPSCLLVRTFPSLACDSFVTIGLKCSDGPEVIATDGDFDATEFDRSGHVVGGWFNFMPDNNLGLPDENGDVLVAQLAVTEGFDISGSFTAFVQGDFGGAPGACPDLDEDEDVDAFDLASLLSKWGECPKPCPADFNDDGTVGPVDLSWLLNGWGLCEDTPLPFQAFELEFSCFASICEIDEECDDDDPCTSDTCAEGTCENPPADCNDNGTPDCEDIADCPPETPACDDCNLNGVPDECDIDSDFSEDVDRNGVPDECVSAQSDGEWSDDIWELDGDNPYPDDQLGVPDLAVTLDSFSIALDVDVEVPALRLINAATLDVTEDGDAGDLTISDAGGVFDGNLLIKGTLNIGGGRMINAAGTVTIGADGVYKSIIGFEGPNSGDMMADEIVVDCGGTLRLEGTMNMDTEGDFTLRSGEDDDKGDCTPPDFETGDNSTAAVGGDFRIEGPANINYNSAQPLLLNGDFDNQSTDAEIFDWSGGGILLNGPLHTIEAAGRERGPCLSGLADNFAFGSLALAEDTLVQVVDEFDNQGDGLAACDETLYVDSLEVSAGAILLTEGCRVYFKQLELAEGGSIPGLGTDVLQILEGCPPDFDNDGAVTASDLANLLGAWGPCPEPCTPGEPAGTCETDLDGDCATGASDLAVLLGSWGPV